MNVLELKTPLWAGDTISAIIVLTLVCSVAIPFIPVAGPLSADDALPLAGVVLALISLAFTRSRITINALAAPFLVLAVLGIASSAANADSLSDFARMSARSTGRFLFFWMLVVAVRPLLAKND